ncbi:MAG: response regulator [Rhodospirillaceae bacterium]|jgi:PAS domain S-box-containing protein|nr:response regulator [Rhodospirillaceae bacterium]MBT5894566.1 response regulator [Rhodospirillaceae bacterium]MBT6428629.1 response regulator [Rhodospirillaceae bacterium]
MSNIAGETVSKGRIARRLILALVLFSSLITAVTTTIQLFVDYRRGVSNIERGFALVESSYLDGLTNSMWSFDDAQIKILLAGMSKLPDMEFISIQVNGETKWSVGQKVSENVLSTKFPMQVNYRGEVWTIGVLTVVASLSSILERLWQDIVVILISNAVKTFFVVGFVFIVFHRMVTRRLGQLVAAIKGLDLEAETTTELSTEFSSARKNSDEIDDIGIALRNMHTDLVASHQSVLERENELRLVTDNLPGSIIHVGMDQCYKFASKTTEIWLNRPVQEMIGKPVRDVLGAEVYEKFRPHIEAAMAGELQEFEMSVTYADGIPREMEITYVPHIDRGGKVVGYFSLALDVSDRHALEERLRQSQKMEAVGQLTGGIAHEFNNLLQVVSGNLELLETNLNNDSVSEKRFQAIHRNVKRGADLTDRLLSFSRRQPLAPRAVDVPQILAVMQGMLGQTLGETVSVEVRLVSDIWSALADPGQLENALLNLALNARDAMPEGGKIILAANNVTIDEADVANHEDRDPGEYVEIYVRDSGSGMSDEAIARAFEPFFTTKDVGKGTGLGLSMVYGFAQQSGGFVEIDSELEAGTTIRIFLPRTDAEGDLARTSVAPTVSAQPGNSAVVNISKDRKTILLVEDDADVRAALRDQITKLGYRVIEAADGAEALSQAEQKQNIDLLFSDIVMPGNLNGLELARQLRRRLPILHVIYTTGYSDDIVAQTGHLDDGALVLRKPYDGKTLEDALARSFDH